MTDQTITDDTQPIEGTAEELTHTPSPQSATGTTLVLPTRQALFPIEPDQVVASMEAYQKLLPRLLEQSDFQDAGKDKKSGKDRKFVKRSGWRKIARAFNLSVVIVRQSVERDIDGTAIRAEVVARAIAPNGQCQDGDGYCSIDETRFQEEKGRKKLENDLRATASTRAKSRAIADLVGMGEVTAEELDHPVNTTAREASTELRKLTDEALAYLLDGDVTALKDVHAALDKQYEGLRPAVALQAVCILARAVKEMRHAQEKAIAEAREEIAKK